MRVSASLYLLVRPPDKFSIDAIAEPGAALVEHDKARERPQPRHQMAEAGVFPMSVEIGNKSGDEDQIERPVADDLIGNANIATFGVARFWRFHVSRPTMWQSANRPVTACATGGSG